MTYPNTPSSDDIVITGPEGSAYDAESEQILHPMHHGSASGFEDDACGSLLIASAHCNGCGERQVEIAITDDDGNALWVKLRPSMAIKFSELLMIHAKAGMPSQ